MLSLLAGMHMCGDVNVYYYLLHVLGNVEGNYTFSIHSGFTDVSAELGMLSSTIMVQNQEISTQLAGKSPLIQSIHDCILMCTCACACM